MKRFTCFLLALCALSFFGCRVEPNEFDQPLPQTPEALRALVEGQVFFFEAGLPYSMLEFTTGGTYTLYGPAPQQAKATPTWFDADAYLKNKNSQLTFTGSWKLQAAFEEAGFSKAGALKLENFGSFTFVAVGKETAQVVLTPTTGTPIETKVAIYTPTFAEPKPLHYFQSYQSHGSDQTAIKVELIGGIGSSSSYTITINGQQTNIMIENSYCGIYTSEYNARYTYYKGTKLATECAVYQREKNGDNGALLQTIKYGYHSDRTLRNVTVYNKKNEKTRSVTAEWSDGNIVSTTTTHYEGGQEFQQTKTYTYTAQNNPTTFIALDLLPDIYQANVGDCDYMALFSGVLGNPPAQLLEQAKSGDWVSNKYAYQLDGQGHPTTATITPPPSSPSGITLSHTATITYF